MVYLNYNNLDQETQQQLLDLSKEEVQQKFGKELKAYSKEHHIDFETLLEEEAIRNLYSYSFVFNL